MVWATLGEAQTAAIKEIAASGSDRIIAIVGGAVLDNTLRRTLEERLRDKKDINDKLFKVGGALGNTVPKIDLGFQLYAYEKPARNAMYGIADLRNFFAHQLDASFASQDRKVTDALSKLKLHDGLTHYPAPVRPASSSPYKIELISDNKTLFLVNLKLALIELMADRQSHPLWTNVPF